jgi:phytoene dehydrogenase-like protein
MKMSEEYDVIIIGGGPNGLTAGAYLAKAGAKVLIVEKKHELGGGLYTEDFGSPFRHNVHAIYMMVAELMPPYLDLGLEERNVTFIRPEVQNAFLFKDGKALVLYTDLERSKASVRKLSEKDADAFERMYREFKDLFYEIIIPSTYVPPVPPVELAEMLGKTELGKKLLDLSEMSPKEIVEHYGFEDPRVKTALLYLGTTWGIHPEVGGVGYMVPLYIYGMMNSALVKGGSHVLSSALQKSVISSGGNILEWAEVKGLILEDGAVKGVKLADGREFRAKGVISTLNPEQTFLQLIGKENLPEDLLKTVEGWQWEEWSLFVINIGIRGDPPKYRAAEFNPDVNGALLAVMGYDDPEDIIRHVKEMEEKKLPSPAGHATCTTKFDSLQAAPGPYGPLHTLRWEGWAPYDIEGKNWDDIKEEYAERCIGLWSEYAPNLKNVKLLFTHAWSPLDIERRLATMRKGSIKHGAYISLQMGYFRPNDRCSCYRTPIKGLYLGGASVYPGGMITLGPGYNSAKVAAEDLGLKVWWSPPDYVTEAAKKGYLRL